MTTTTSGADQVVNILKAAVKRSGSAHGNNTDNPTATEVASFLGNVAGFNWLHDMPEALLRSKVCPLLDFVPAEPLVRNFVQHLARAPSGAPRKARLARTASSASTTLTCFTCGEPNMEEGVSWCTVCTMNPALHEKCWMKGFGIEYYGGSSSAGLQRKRSIFHPAYGIEKDDHWCHSCTENWCA